MKRVLLITGSFIVFVCVTAMLYLMHTEAGLQWLITNVTDSIPGLSIRSAEGRLSGPMKIRGVSYRSGESSYAVDEIALDWKPSRLMFMEARISSLKVEGVSIAAAAQTKEAEPASHLPEVSVPLKIVLKKAIINNISIRQSGESDPLNIQTVSLKGTMGQRAIRIERLDIKLPGLMLSAKGKISPRGDYPMSIAASWEVRDPEYEKIAGQGEITGSLKLLKITQEISTPFHCSVSMKISDIIKDLRWEGDLSVREFNAVKLNRTWTDLTLSGALSGYGTETNANISSLNMHILNGILTGNGAVGWQPAISWDFNINTEGLNPGTHWPQWQGSMDMTAHSSGQYEKGVLTVKPSEVTVEGLLRERQLKAHARLSATESHLELSALEVSSGGSHLSASGSVADDWSLKWEAHIRDAGDLVPHVKGAIEGSGSVIGSRAYPVIKGSINAREVSYDNYGAERVKAVVDIDTKGEKESLLDITAANVEINGKKIKIISLKGSGGGPAHSIYMDAAMDAAMDKQSIALLITGGYKDEVWTGQLGSALLDAGSFGRWSLREPASLYASGDKAGSELCMASNDTDLCLQTSWDRAGGVKAGFSLTDLPLSALKHISLPSIENEGVLSGSGEILYAPEGTMSGNVSLIMPSGKIYYQADGERNDLLIGRSSLDIILNESALDANAEITFPGRGHIQGGINLPGFMPGITALPSQQIIGHAAAKLNDLDLIPVFLPKVNKASGSVDAEIKIGGTLAETAVTGEMILQEGAADIPDVGLKLTDINISLKADEKGRVAIEGRLSSGSGYAAIQGTVGLHKEKAPSAVLQIQGEDFEVVKIPGTWLIVSPDVDLRIEDKMIDLAGSLKIPQAKVEPPDISLAVLPSKDVIVVDMPIKEKEGEWSVTGKLKLSLGDNVRFSGYGLTCRIAGGIDLTEQPGKATQGHGEFHIVDGKYKAYGQDLTIEKGRLIFVGLIDDPGLDIRAFRKIKDVTAGVNVQGTLKAPGFNVYSEPSMEESDVLSYILYGRPMRQLSSSEGNDLYGTALSAGLSAGGFAAKQIGAAFGVEDVEVEKGEEPEQSALFIGKYLSPRLYLSYGIGLFEPVNTVRLRYDLTKRLQVQTEYGLESGGDLFYVIER